jgi:hypothetical protein
VSFHQQAIFINTFLSTSDLYYNFYGHNLQSKIVIYDRNDSDLYYKTMIQANLALDSSINYDHKCSRKVCYKLKRSFIMVKHL